MIYPLVRDLAAPGAPVRVPVAVTCRVLGFYAQAFYQWKRRPLSERDWDDAHLTNAAVGLDAVDLCGRRQARADLSDCAVEWAVISVAAADHLCCAGMAEELA